MSVKCRRKRIAVAGIGLVCAVFLLVLWVLSSGNAKKEMGDLLWEKEGGKESSVTVAGGSISKRPSIHENGIFYIEGNQLHFYDYQTDKGYIFCSDNDCDHIQKECNAYVGDSFWCGGFTMHQNRTYVLCSDRERNKVELLSMDLRGQDRKTLVTFGEEGVSLDGCMVSNVGDVIYCGGFAYLSFTLFKNEQEEIFNGQQLLAVRLSDGRVSKLTEVWYGKETMKFEIVSEKDVVYSVRYHDTMHTGDSEPKICYYHFSPESEEIQLKYEEEMEIYEGFMGYQQHLPKETFFGELDGKWFLSGKNSNQMNGEITYFLWDPKTEEKEILEVTVGGDGYFGTGSYADVSNVLYNEEEILWIQSLPDTDTKHELLLYNIETGEKRKLYDIDNEKDDYSPDLRGVTSKYVITAKQDAQNRLTYYITDKSDFEKNCLEESRPTPVVIR